MSSTPSNHRELAACATYTFLADGSDLKTAVDAYTADPLCVDDPADLCSTEQTYGGLINDWCVGAVEDMSDLFRTDFAGPKVAGKLARLAEIAGAEKERK